MSITALVTGEKTNFQFILRLLNTNVDGKQKIMYALTQIKGVGRRYSNLVCKKADVDLTKRYVHHNPPSITHIPIHLLFGGNTGKREWSSLDLKSTYEISHNQSHKYHKTSKADKTLSIVLVSSPPKSSSVS